MTQKKTQSQRLRAVLWLLWEKSGKHGDFDDYYNDKMEWLIDRFKEKLD